MTDIDILVNGNRCKTYIHEGKTYIEGKAGSEYEIEIKNHTNGRIEAVATVDGLSVMSGKPGTTEEGGYVIDPYSSYKIKGFRYSDERCGAFKFNYKNQSYAKSKGDNSEINCGVIACKVYQEKVYVPRYIKRLVPRTVWDETWEFQDNIWYNSITSTPATGGLYGEGRFGYSVSNSGTDTGMLRSRGIENQPNIMYSSCVSGPVEEPTKEVFNLGTEWGSDKVSKVVSTTFNRNILITDFVLYYTDREGLLGLGIPLNSPAKINFPESFPGNLYAQPPKGWKG